MRTAGERNVRISNKTVSIHRLKICVRSFARIRFSMRLIQWGWRTYTHTHTQNRTYTLTQIQKRANFFVVSNAHLNSFVHNSCTVKYIRIRCTYCALNTDHRKNAMELLTILVYLFSVDLYQCMSVNDRELKMNPDAFKWTFNKNSNIFPSTNSNKTICDGVFIILFSYF